MYDVEKEGTWAAHRGSPGRVRQDVGRAAPELVWVPLGHVLGSGQWDEGDARSLRGRATRTAMRRGGRGVDGVGARFTS